MKSAKWDPDSKLTEDMHVDYTLDASGLVCPLPVVKASQAIAALHPGQVLEIISTDVASKEDITSWAERFGHQLLRTESRGDVFYFYVRKAK